MEILIGYLTITTLNALILKLSQPQNGKEAVGVEKRVRQDSAEARAVITGG